MAGQGRRKNDGRDHIRTGKAGEFLTAFELTARGLNVSVAAEGLPYDLLTEIGARVLRVQVKTSSRPISDGWYVFDTTTGGTDARAYTIEDIDVFALVALDRRQVAFISRRDVEGRRLLKIDFRRFRKVDVTGDTLVNVVEQLLLH